MTAVQQVEAPPFGRDRRIQAWAVTEGISEAGDVAWNVGLAWTATRVGGPVEAGLVLGAGTIPRAAVMLWGGTLADRLDARRLMVLANIGRIVVLLAAVATFSVHAVSVPLLVAVAVAFGALDAVYQPASVTLPRQMVRTEDLPAAAALFQISRRIAVFVGGPLGGFLVGVGGLRAVMAVDALSFAAISVFLAIGLRPRFPLPRSTAGSVVHELREAWCYLRSTPPVRTLVIALSGLNLFVGPALAVGLALRVHSAGWSSTSLGVFEACVGVGAALGALATFRWHSRNPARTGLLILVAQAAAIATLGLGSYAALVAATTTIGITAGLASAQLSGAFQAMVDGEYLGRMSSVTALGDDVLMPFAMMAFGALTAGLSLTSACVITGCLFAVLVLWSASRPGITGHVTTPPVTGPAR